MKFVIGSDHAAVALKNRLRDQLREWGHEVNDVGTNSSESVDYPDYAHVVAGEVQGGAAERGVLVCGTGVGMAIAANRHRGVRAAACSDAFSARMARQHNDANVLCLGARILAPEYALELLRIFVDTPFEGARHGRRVAKLEPPEGRC
ncbi:MAG: ribose 5-phosphate isomerase B [Deltaproteobacteria bacterium]|nr:ribose 5-phosphate isomerase B [Deltaproteobacteria bacterium]